LEVNGRIKINYDRKKQHFTRLYNVEEKRNQQMYGQLSEPNKELSSILIQLASSVLLFHFFFSMCCQAYGGRGGGAKEDDIAKRGGPHPMFFF
jgi:hypothetical protein